ncbi:MAG: peptidase domain-containing ABC transporter [Bacteroidetes bacterium]|nr:peptidase domain-containing ABC transporter [Bacteroidota bacterium]
MFIKDFFLRLVAFLISTGRRKRIIVRQRDLTDCGAACLVSIASFYNLQIPLARVRQYAGTNKQGTTVMGLIEAAEKLNFQAKGGRGTLESLLKIPLPAIAHIELENGYHHYVVVYKVASKYITIMDPAKGQLYEENKADFLKKWTRIIVILIPGNDFKKGDRKISSFQRFWNLMKPNRHIMLQSLLCAILYTVLGLSTSFYVQKIVDYVLPENNFRLLNLMSILMIVLLAFQLFAGYFKSLIGIRMGQYLDINLILGYYRHVFKLPQIFFDSMRVGEVINRVNDAVKIRSFINDIAMNIVVNILIIGFSISIIFLHHWKLALITLIIIPVYLIIYYISNKINKKWQRQIMEKSASLESQMIESINGAGTIKRFGLEAYNNNKTENRFIELIQSVYKSNLKNLYLANASELLTQLFTIAIVWVGSYFVMAREISPGQLLSFYSLLGYFTHPVFSLINSNRNIQDALIAADRLFEIIELETEIEDETKIVLIPEMLGDIQFSNVSFTYGARVAVFNNLNLQIKRNSITAVVGESGCGKSTILGLLQNLYPVAKGNIYIGGTDIKYFDKKSLRQIISVVPQKIDLFAGTVIENIAIGEYQPDMQHVLLLSYLLGIHEFIEKLPHGYNTFLNEQGINLSGGQRQRIAIARALYRNPEILILDEATSSVDPPGEKKVLETLSWFKNQQKTIVVIAHKISMIKNADKIILLKNGEVAEQGSHAELLEKKSEYENLFRDYLSQGQKDV